MQISFNPSLNTSRMSNANCCGGGKKVAFGKSGYVVVPEQLAKSASSFVPLYNAIIAGDIVNSPAFRKQMAKVRRLTNDKLIHSQVEDAEKMLGIA